MNSDDVNVLRRSIAAALALGQPPTSIARDLGCARSTIYKVMADQARGIASIDKRATGNGHYPSWTDQVRAVILDTRGRNPSWGPRILYAHLARDPNCPIPRDELPSPSTIGRWFQEAGLARKPIGPRDTRHYPDPRPTQPGTVTLDGWGPWHIRASRLYLCTAQDRYSRLAVAVPALGGPVSEGQRGLTAQHWAHALSLVVSQTLVPGGHELTTLYLDNGVGLAPAFGSLPLAPRLALALGAKVVFIPPAQPWRNGRLERFHWTLESEFFRDARPQSTAAALEGLVEWLNDDNTDRPHSRLGYRAPGELVTYAPLTVEALRPVGRNRPLATGMVECLRLVMNDGAVELWGAAELRVSPVLAGQYVRVRFPVPGPAAGEVISQLKGATETVVARFEHDLDAPGRDPKRSFVPGAKLFDFADEVPKNQGLDEERDANRVSRRQRRPSKRDRVLSGRAGGENV